MTATTKTGLTYKELQAALKELRANGYTLQVKLNAKEYDLRMEWVRLTAIIEREASKAHLQELCSDLDIQVLKTEHVSASTFGDYCDLSDRDNYIGCYAQCKLSDKHQYVCDIDATPLNGQSCELTCSVKRVEHLIPDWLRASVLTSSVKEYRYQGDTFFDHEYQGQYTELTCELPLPVKRNDRVLQQPDRKTHHIAAAKVNAAPRCKEYDRRVRDARFAHKATSANLHQPAKVKAQAKPVSTALKVKLEVPKADKSYFHTNHVHQRFLCKDFEAKKAAYLAKLGKTELQAIDNLKSGVKVAKQAARNLKAFADGFMTGLKAA